MSDKKGFRSAKKRIFWAAVVVGAVLVVLTSLFIRAVQRQLWEQSIRTIMESTQQGCNTLRVQLKDDYEAMGNVAGYIKNFTMEENEEIDEVLSSFSLVEKGVGLYLPDGTSLPAPIKKDEKADIYLKENTKNTGIIDPHISSVTGVNVFDLFVKMTLKDGAECYLVKEYEVDEIIDSFTLSFYNNAGFSYVVNGKGDVLIRPPHPNSNKTVKNLFDMLPDSYNDKELVGQFAESLESLKTGWAVFNYQGEDTVFCYTPLKLESDWYLISIIPQKVVSAQTEEILRRALALIGCILLGIALLAAFYLRYAKRTNRKLRNQADYIGHLYNAVPEGIALLTVEFPHHFIQINQEGLFLLDYPDGSSNDVIKGRQLDEVICPEDRKRMGELFKKTAESGNKNVFECRVIKADGSLFWAAGIVERTLDENGLPVLITAIHDITNEKLAEEEAEREKLQERITLVGAISNAYPVIISLNLTKDQIRFIYVKQGLMLNLGDQDSFSVLFSEMEKTIHPESREDFRSRFAPDSLKKALGQEKNEVFLEAKQLLSDGNYHWISTQIIYVDNPYSEDKLAILISRRIDEQRHEEEQRRQALQSALDNAKAASEAKGRFLSNMSHDIRTPMNAIVGMTAIATAHLDDRNRVLECLKKIGLSSKHLLSLINDVLDMSKIESGKVSIREEPFNFAELVADVVELVRAEAKARQQVLDIHMELLKNEEVIGDPLRIRQVCINILSNAIKYTEPGGKIHVEVKQEGSLRRGYQRYLFRCTDNGIGMSEKFLKKLFLPFERMQDSTSSKVVGTGLGMAITKNIVDLMNGDIQVESKLGEGSVFTVTIPLQTQTTQQEDVPEEWIGIRCLIVDDDRQTCENAVELLESMGLRPQFTTNGACAVRTVIEAKDTEDPYLLVIVDWKMPDMDGVEVARRIRAEIGPEVPVIVLTAYDWTEIEAEARNAGVTAFISKPFYRTKICYLLSELSEEKDLEVQQSFSVLPDFGGKRILLVEDNEMNREIAGTLIEEMGLKVEEAYDGAQAVQMFENSEAGYYDLILMDIQMPKMDGYEATKRIRSLDRSDAAQIPIIAMTANAFEEDVRKALRSGMDAHFAKPIDMAELELLFIRYLCTPRA